MRLVSLLKEMTGGLENLFMEVLEFKRRTIQLPSESLPKLLRSVEIYALLGTVSFAVESGMFGVHETHGA